MAGKKDFSNVFDAIAETTAEGKKERKTYSTEEQEKYRQEGKTMGRKGCKAVRINMAFSPDVHDYIKTMARVRGESITDFTNYVFARSMEENRETYEKAKAFKEAF